MIKYEGTSKKYLYNSQDIENILNIINSNNFYNMYNCTQENVSTFLNAVNTFFVNIKVEKQTVMLEKHETEEEAREYFGQEFIDKFDKLLTILDKQKTIVALHGTSVELCPKICETGLQYKMASLSATAVQQRMAYGQREMHYEKYESLLNWGHKNYKGLVIIAVPYECYYKEGLWNHFRETGSSFYGGQDYRIDPDFIVGYLDIEGKNIVINPKYNRQHNYQDYDKDNDLFREQKDMDNEKITQELIESEKQFQQAVNTQEAAPIIEEPEDTIDVTSIPSIIEDLQGTFNSIKMGFPNGMNESRYKDLLEELSYGFNDIQKVLPLLKTNEQVKKEQEERFSMFNFSSKNFPDVSQGEDPWGENIEWDDPDEQKTGKSL